MALAMPELQDTNAVEAQLAHFEREGWVIFEDVFDP